MGVTIQQIAEKAGVSRGTVDRALNNRGRISPEAEKKIRQIADELGYVPKSRKRAIQKKELRIGVVTFLSTRVFSSEIRRGIRQAGEELAHQGIRVLVRECESMDEQEQIRAIDELLEQHIYGLAIMPVNCAAVRDKLNEVAETYRIPIVTFNSDIIGTRRLCFIGMDNRRGGQAAAGLMGMLTRGTGNILIITGFFTNYANNSRVDGFIEELKNCYPEIKIAGVHCTFDDEAEVENVVKTSLLGINGINGILVVSSGQAGISGAFRSLGLEKRPYVIYFDQTPCTEEALREDTADFVIDQDCFTQGYEAAQILARLLVKNQQPDSEYYYTNIYIKTRYNLQNCPLVRGQEPSQPLL